MGDPEFRSDEKVLVRTPGVYVKSIPFEGILTNKRIILIDRAKNLLPPKEIPLVTIKEVEPGENAIRDQIVTLTVMAKTGETRQMILTFSRQAGGNRIKERDAWVRIIRETPASSYDQVIRKVIPSPEQAPRRTEPVPAPRYEVVPSPVRQPVTSAGQDRPAGTAMDDFSPIRRVAMSPAPAAPPVAPPAAPPAPAVGQSGASDSGVFCPKCGNRVPAQSVFCNRCGSQVGQVLPQSPPVPAYAAAPVTRTAAARPIDEEIQSIEPLIERSSARTPHEALRSAPVESPLKHSLSWDEDKPELASAPEPALPGEVPAAKGFIPRLFSAKSADTPAPAPVYSYSDTSDTLPPPRPPRRGSFMPGKQTLLTAAVAVVAILVVAAGAVFVYPMVAGGGLALPFGSGDVSPTPTSGSSVLPSGTIVVKETPAPVIPATGIYVHVNYLGGFKGSYGIPDAVTTVPGNSGDRVWEVENATNSTVGVTFEKLDGSSHEILVEIYKDGKALSSGTTTVGHGSVTLSVNMVTGIAAAPITSGSSSSAPKTTTAAAAITPVVVETPAPVAETTTGAAVNSTTAAP